MLFVLSLLSSAMSSELSDSARISVTLARLGRVFAADVAPVGAAAGTACSAVRRGDAAGDPAAAAAAAEPAGRFSLLTKWRMGPSPVSDPSVVSADEQLPDGCLRMTAPAVERLCLWPGWAAGLRGTPGRLCRNRPTDAALELCCSPGARSLGGCPAWEPATAGGLCCWEVAAAARACDCGSDIALQRLVSCTLDAAWYAASATCMGVAAASQRYVQDWHARGAENGVEARACCEREDSCLLLGAWRSCDAQGRC